MLHDETNTNEKEIIMESKNQKEIKNVYCKKERWKNCKI